jgi:hypothetical protein
MFYDLKICEIMDICVQLHWFRIQHGVFSFALSLKESDPTAPQVMVYSATKD